MSKRRWGAAWRVPLGTRIWFAVTIIGGLLVGWGIIWSITGEVSLPVSAILLIVGAVLLALVYRYRGQWKDEDGNPLH